MNENANHDEDDFMGRIGGKYDFIMMVGDGTVYGFEGREIQFELIEDWGVPNGFQWKPIKGKDVDFNWLPLDGEYEYDDDEEDWVPFEDMVGSRDDEERYNDDGFDYREWM